MWQKLGYKKMPEGTTQAQWDQYELDQKNHEAWINGRKEFMNEVLEMVQSKHIIQIEVIRDHFTRKLDEKLSMDAPNRPGYYRANND